MPIDNSFKFISFKVSKLVYNENKSFNNNSDSNEIEIAPNFEVDYHSKNKRVFVDLSIKIENKNAPFSLQTVLTGTFDLDHELEKDALDKLARINLAAILFPFLRQVVADLTTKAGFTPLLLPPVNFSKAYKPK